MTVLNSPWYFQTGFEYQSPETLQSQWGQFGQEVFEFFQTTVLFVSSVCVACREANWNLNWNRGWYMHDTRTMYRYFSNIDSILLCIILLTSLTQDDKSLRPSHPRDIFYAFRCNNKAWLIFWVSIFFYSLYTNNEIP